MKESNEKSLMCMIFGHDFVAEDINTEMYTNGVVCTRCAKRTVLPVKEVCKKSGHHYKIVAVFRCTNESNLPVTFRQYQCCRCGDAYSDGQCDCIIGRWDVDKSGKLVPARSENK